MSEPLNGHLELRDRRTGETVGLVVPQAEWTALRDQIDALTRQRDTLQADYDRLHREYDLFRQSMLSFLETERKPITADEMEEVKRNGMRGEELRAEIERLCAEESH